MPVGCFVATLSGLTAAAALLLPAPDGLRVRGWAELPFVAGLAEYGEPLDCFCAVEDEDCDELPGAPGAARCACRLRIGSALVPGAPVFEPGAGGAAHLPGMCAAKTDLPVLGVPVKSSILNGVDSLLSIVQMPAGIAVGTLAIGPAGATNAAIMAAQILGLTRPEIATNVANFRAAQTGKVSSNNIPGQA